MLNTPNLTSMKWWPGGLGLLCTHVVLMAQLIIDGKPHGLHPFILQLRDQNHKHLPGVETGDIGTKFAWNQVDKF